MNHIVEINRFYEWLETNDIPKSAISLWHALMHINNKTGWLPEFNVAISVLELKTGFKHSELYKARDSLQDYKRIIWKSRGGNLSANYQIIPFCLHVVETNGIANGETSGNANEVTKERQIGNILKLNATNLNQILEEEPFFNLRSMVPPDDGVDRNFEGLLNFLTSGISITETDAMKIVHQSNYGEKGTAIWKAILKVRESNSSRDWKKHIGHPANYILKYK